MTRSTKETCRPLRSAAGALLLLLCAAGARGQQRAPLVTPGGEFAIEAETQRKDGDVYSASGNVDLRYQNARLRADQIEGNRVTGEARASGHVQFDYGTQHIEGEEAQLNLYTGRGRFLRVRGTVSMPRRANPSVLISSNPLYFEAQEIVREDEKTYKLRGAWMTICLPERPTWKFYAPSATLKLEKRIALVNANFRVYRIPLFYFPYASLPAGGRVRQSGFLLPEISHTNSKGWQAGDAYYWAPTEWLDVEAGAQYYSERGWGQSGLLRLAPAENTRAELRYFGVMDRQNQGGHVARFLLESKLPGGWHAVADLNNLSSLTFRLAFSTTFEEATVSEVHSSAFLTNNFRGFSLNFFSSDYKDFLSAAPPASITLRRMPGARISSVEQAPWRRLPFYFGFHALADGAYRGDPNLTTAAIVQRSEIAPRVTIPLHWGPWLGVTPTFQVRTTRYGAQLQGGLPVGGPLVRNTGEVTVDLRLPELAGIWEAGEAKWKHTIEPAAVYRYVNGVKSYDRIIRFNETDTLTDTNEAEYSLTQRLYRRKGQGPVNELLSWRVAQKYYFDPTFGGALAPGQRNVFQALNSITPFAFADSYRRFSPLVSDFHVDPGGRWDVDFLTNYDPVRGRVTAYGTLATMHPFGESFLTLAHYRVQANTILQPFEQQIRALAGWGKMNRKGWSTAVALNYDVNRKFFQYQVMQVTYNGNCCGISFEYRRLALGPVSSENQFRASFLIANIGTFGTLRHEEKLF
jgi:LPS-assembly protein